MWTHHVFLSKRIKGKKTLPSFYASVYTTNNNYYNFKEKQQKQAVISVKILYYYEKRLENKI